MQVWLASHALCHTAPLAVIHRFVLLASQHILSTPINAISVPLLFSTALTASPIQPALVVIPPTMLLQLKLVAYFAQLP